MNMHHVPRLPYVQSATAYLSLSQTLRRLAHGYKRWALEAEQDANLETYRHWRECSDRAWNNAKFYLQRAREDFGRSRT